MVLEKLQVKGSMVATLEKSNGDVEVTRKDNIIVTSGYDFICDAIGKDTGRPGAMTHIAIGTSDQAADLADETLVAEISRKVAVYAHTP
ncbi:hypothetical protein ABXV18_25010, partial [Vibrio owensii]|uniref:hypothetical protein n=1 Tax=Vibrio owensii TaxID=696485 RepID=UPI003391F681